MQAIDQALVKRGFADPGIRLAFIGKEAHVQQALSINPNLLNLLPLRLTLEMDAKQVRISSDDLKYWRERFPLVVNHFKSKGSCPTSAADPNADQGDGQCCWNALRVE